MYLRVESSTQKNLLQKSPNKQHISIIPLFTHLQTHTVYMRLKNNEEFKTECTLTEHTNTK